MWLLKSRIVSSGLTAAGSSVSGGQKHENIVICQILALWQELKQGLKLRSSVGSPLLQYE
jgi:hypothetical protein